MKRLVLLLLSVLMCVSLFSCEGDISTSSSSEDTSSQEVASNENVSSVAVTSSEEVVSVESKESTSSQPEKIYLELDETKPQEYNEAIKAYNKFLNYECDEFEYGVYYEDKKHRFGSYTLFDVTHDGIPELHTDGLDYDIFSYKNGEVTFLYTADISQMNGSTKPLKNGDILSEKRSTVTEYTYTTFDSNGSYTITYFSSNGSIAFFNNKEVPMEEYEELTKDYWDKIDKKADVTWHRYSK